MRHTAIHGGHLFSEGLFGPLSVDSATKKCYAAKSFDFLCDARCPWSPTCHFSASRRKDRRLKEESVRREEISVDFLPPGAEILKYLNIFKHFKPGALI